MSYHEAELDFTKIINILQEYDIPLTILDDDVLINTYEPINDEEISLLMNVLYTAARKSDRKITDADIKRLINIQKVLEKSLNKREEQEMNDQQHSNSVQAIAEQERKKTEILVKQEIKEKMNRIHQALQDPRLKGLFYKPDATRMLPEDAFAAIKANPRFNKQMMDLTLNRKRAGKSRVFRRKNKKTTSKSRRNAQRTQRTRRHRKSSTRRSTRK